MTNKPMLSVERELLERAASAIEKHHGSLQWVIASDLRAILDKPDAQHQGNPVAGHCTHPSGCKSCSWCGFKAEQPTQVHPNNSALLGLVQSNISIDDRGFYHLSGIHPDNFKRALDASGAKLSGEVKAHRSSATVVMPSRDARDDPDDENVYEESYAKGWNEALDKVAILNGVKP